MSPCRTQRLNVAPASGTSALMICFCMGVSVGGIVSKELCSGRRSDCCSRVRRLPISTRGWRLDDDRFAGLDQCGVGALQPLHRAVLPPHIILADPAVLAAGEAE